MSSDEKTTLHIETNVFMTKRGENYFGLCPYHQEKTPSFSFSPKRNVYHCFDCGVTGDDHYGFEDGVLRVPSTVNV